VQARLIAALAGAAVLTAALLSGGPASAVPQPTIPEPAIGQFQAFTQSHPERYSGLVVDEQTGTVRVYVPSGGGAAASTDLAHYSGSALAATGRPLKVEIRTAKYSLRQLDQTMAAVDTLQPWAGSVRGTLSIWYVDPASNTVHVGLTKVTPQAVADAEKYFGDRVSVVQKDRMNTLEKVVEVKREVIDPAPSRSAAAQLAGILPTRLLDSTPYYSGTRIYRWTDSTHVTLCTTATLVATSVAHQMVTAGHCGPTNALWYQGYIDSTGTLHTSGSMGTVVRVEWGNNRMDAEVIGGGSYWQSAVYGGPNNADISWALGVNGQTSVAVGQSFCADGSTTGEACGAKIYGINTCVNVNENGTVYKVCNQAVATATNTTPIVQPGDSGGPVWTLSSNVQRVLMAGIISNGNAAGTNLGFTQMTSFTSAFGVSVLGGDPVPCC
jgi:hypothetical protein